MPKLNYEEMFVSSQGYINELRTITNTAQSRADQLQAVGANVMTKTFGHNWRAENGILDYFRDANLEWFPYYLPSDNITLTKTGISFHSPRFSTDPKARALTVPKHILSLSDRDFAALIREAVKTRKKHIARIEKVLAEHKIADNAQRISELEEDNRRLQNLINKEQ